MFLHLSTDEAQEYIDGCKEELENEIKKLEDQLINGYTAELKDLKVKLYAKFGNNINLEEDTS